MMYLQWLWHQDCTADVIMQKYFKLFLSCDVLQTYFPKATFHQMSMATLKVIQKEVTPMAFSDENSSTVQWPNPHKESLWFTHCLLKKDGKTCQLPEHDILPVIPLFFFSGVALAHRAVMAFLFHCWEQRGVRLHWSQLAANRLYHYCSLSACSVQRKNDMGEDPQSSPSGPTDWKLLDCLIIKTNFSLEAKWCVVSPVRQKVVAGQSEWNLVLWNLLTLHLFSYTIVLYRSVCI